MPPRASTSSSQSLYPCSCSTPERERPPVRERDTPILMGAFCCAPTWGGPAEATSAAHAAARTHLPSPLNPSSDRTIIVAPPRPEATRSRAASRLSPPHPPVNHSAQKCLVPISR